MGGPTLIFGEGYSPEGLEGPALLDSLGEEGAALNAVLLGDSEQLDSDPESSWSLLLKSSSAPEWLAEEAIGVDA